MWPKKYIILLRGAETRGKPFGLHAVKFSKAEKNLEGSLSVNVIKIKSNTSGPYLLYYCFWWKHKLIIIKVGRIVSSLFYGSSHLFMRLECVAQTQILLATVLPLRQILTSTSIRTWILLVAVLFQSVSFYSHFLMKKNCCQSSCIYCTLSQLMGDDAIAVLIKESQLEYQAVHKITWHACHEESHEESQQGL